MSTTLRARCEEILTLIDAALTGTDVGEPDRQPNELVLTSARPGTPALTTAPAGR